MNKKKIREKGKIQLSRYFQEFKNGESVAVVREEAIMVNFPKRLQGLTGIVIGKRGRSYLIEIKGNKKR